MTTIKNQKYKNFTTGDFSKKDLSSGLTIESCIGCTFSGLRVTGGTVNILLLNCRDVTLVEPVVFDPDRAVNDPDDPESHSIQLDKCTGCIVKKPVVQGHCLQGDGVSLFNSSYCWVSDPFFSQGLVLAPKAWAFIIDGPAGKGNKLSSGCGIQIPKGIAICGGSGHWVENFFTKTVTVSGEYYKKAKVENVVLHLAKADELYVHTPTVRNLTTLDCIFKKDNR